MQEFEPSKKSIREFTERISRESKDVKDSNLLRLGIGQALVYLDFLEITFNRYQEDAGLYRENFKKMQALFQKDGKSHQVTEEQEIIFEESSRLSIKVRLDIESFYLFAHVLLNKLTNFPGRYLKHDFRRGLDCGSHNKFWKSIENVPQFNIPENLKTTAGWLAEKIIDYRDKIITHTFKAEHIERMLIKGHGFDSEGSMYITSVVLYPESKTPENVNSEKLESLIPRLNDYIQGYIELLERNSDKSILN